MRIGRGRAAVTGDDRRSKPLSPCVAGMGRRGGRPGLTGREDCDRSVPDTRKPEDLPATDLVRLPRVNQPPGPVQRTTPRCRGLRQPGFLSQATAPAPAGTGSCRSAGAFRQNPIRSPVVSPCARAGGQRRTGSDKTRKEVACRYVFARGICVVSCSGRAAIALPQTTQPRTPTAGGSEEPD